MPSLPASLTLSLTLIFLLAACGDIPAGEADAQDVVSPPAGSVAYEDTTLDRIVLPDGFRVALYATGVDNARMIVLSESGTLFISTRGEGDLYAARDLDEDGFAERVDTLATGMNLPNGIALRDGDLYFAEIDKVWRIDDIESKLPERMAGDDPPGALGLEPALVSDAFPGDRHHGWKFIAFGPDDKLYVPVGAPSNICEPGDPYASIMRMDPDGSNLEVFARGVRNSVGFTWHPETDEMWFTDNGRDMMGDDIPPCELNHAPEAGMHFGYPYFHGGDIADPEFGEGHTATDYTFPAQPLGPHVAPLGLEFYTASNFPDEYRGRLFIAEHGSWNRSSKIGYRVMQVTLDGDEVTSYEPFATGWLQGEETSGRPVDIEVMADGSMLVSDDQGGRIYRIWHE